jgi:hypothetical protein
VGIKIAEKIDRQPHKYAQNSLTGKLIVAYKLCFGNIKK